MAARPQTAGQARILIKAGLWLPPGGHVEPDEHPARTACREVAEELGITVDLTPVSAPRSPPRSGPTAATRTSASGT
ncbi:NUDIX domain-containing protein [Nocardia sp. NPDC024068]|uniref:NUDIX domain-containing protein n=1 Tax=Nocardia sp. NPDC024068 TaxID=3157197 RepID=UPI0033DCD729